MKKTSAALAAIALSTLALTAACSSSSSSSDASPAASGSMVGGMTTCDEATITEAVQKVQTAEDPNIKVWAIGGLNCDNGWAVVQPTVGSTEDNAITYTQVFQAEGQFWIPKSGADVCGTADENDPSKYPSDAQIPEALYEEGCNTN